MNRREIIILFLCLAIGFALRFYRFDKKSLWMDEIHTYNDSRDDFRNQLKFYKENPAFLHPPLFFILTHQFYPFQKPERDLRIVPLIVGTLSIPMIYFLSRAFSPRIAIPCTLSLTFMAYHISLSQDGRSYAFLMFLGMVALYFFIKHLSTLRRRYLALVALFFAALFHTSYSSIPFLAISQLLWLYRIRGDGRKPTLSSLLILNGLTLLFCLPWITFIVVNYKGEIIMDPTHTEGVGSFWHILYGVFHDWVPHLPLMITSLFLLTLSPFLSKPRRNPIILLSLFILPIGGLYLYCRMLNVSHFITSRYFITFLPLFFITLYLSLDFIEIRFERFKRLMRFRLLFVILFIASSLVILPFYYRSEKQDLRGLVGYLKSQLREGDKMFVETPGYLPGILHYLGVHPKGRHHTATTWKEGEKAFRVERSFNYQNKTFRIYHSPTCCTQYVVDGSRLWIVASKWGARNIKESSPCILKGYFDGSFLNFSRFPDDASMYLFLWDPESPEDKGIEVPIE
ncbi:MAG: Dolichyl-phosphate-mannose-protein mannosyltransferase [Deltaproteobacteria bacterium]|nr:Dolichyl-phosphate-mannose-protein mannosyltransferase [Deltaproteobacteria bacterium]